MSLNEKLKKVGGMESYDVHFSYIDKENISIGGYMDEE